MAKNPVKPRGAIEIAEAAWLRTQRSKGEVMNDAAEADERTQRLRSLRLLKEAAERGGSSTKD